MNAIKHELSSPAIALSDAEMLRYARQILLNGWDIEAQTNLKKCSVLIIGMGGLGCPLAETLVRAGIGNLFIVDEDIIEVSNLQRQTLFTSDDLGKSKALVAEEKLKKINEFSNIVAFQQRFEGDKAEQLIETVNNQLIKNSLSKINLICDCTDNFKSRDFINQLSIKFTIPLLSASAIAQTGQLALFEAHKHTGCYHCLFNGEGDDERTCATSGVLTSTTQIMGNLQAHAALSFLGLNKNPIEQTLLLWQGETMSLRKLKYKRNIACPACGETPKR